MRFHVFRYLSKPIDRQRLFRNLKDALDLYHSRLVKVPIETRQGVHVLPVSSIIMVEAQGKKVIVHTTTQDFEAIHTMPYWLELLPSNRFFRRTGVLLSTMSTLPTSTVCWCIWRTVSLTLI